MKRYTELTELLDNVWGLLVRGMHQARHDFHWPVVATTNGERAGARTVVLRNADPESRELWMYSDQRAQKADDLGALPRMEWCFYDKRHRWQVRASGPTLLQRGGPEIDTIWEGLPPEGRKNYASEKGPGRELQAAGDGLAADGEEVAEKLNAGKANFLLIRTQVEALDVLHLHPDGHYRARFSWEERWQGSWIVP